MSSSDRFPYLTATVLDQAFLDACGDNLTNQLELAVDIDSPTGVIHASDRNKYVGGTFYEARLKFPVIKRTLGDWLSGTLEFSTIDMKLNNVDGKYNSILPGGADYGGWIGQSITVSLGLRNVGSTYKPIFSGNVTPVGGFGRDVTALKLTARDRHETVNLPYPTTVFLRTDWPKIEDEIVGKGIPLVWGDYTIKVNPKGASIPAFPVNGNDPKVNGSDTQVIISISSPGVFTATNHCFDNDDPVQLDTDGTLPSPLAAGTDYYVVNRTVNTFELATAPAGPSINTSGTQNGAHKVKFDPTVQKPNVAMVISESANTFLGDVFLHRGDTWFQVPPDQIVNVNGTNNYLEVKQATPTASTGWIDNGPFYFSKGDNFFAKVKGKDLGAYSGNAVSIAKDILKTFGGLVDADFDANWDTYKDKTTPAQSAIKLIGARHHQQEQAKALETALSLLNQVRLEVFPDADLKLKLNSLAFEDWPAAPTYTVKNWDVKSATFAPQVDIRNNFNRAKGVYNRLPDTGEDTYETAVFLNAAAIAQVGRQLSKTIVFPNLYLEADVVNQVKEMIKLASASLEVIDAELTWRSMLQDVGGFVLLNVQIQSTVYQNVPAMIRQIGYDPDGLKMPIQLWSMQMVPYPGWAPGFPGIVGGSTAIITQE